MTNFDDHLWSHLAERGADRASARRPGESATSRRPLIFGGTAGLAAAVAAAVIALSATSATAPAFAVTRHHDGSVTVNINRRSGIVEANRKLAAMGIHARMKADGQDQWFSGSCTVIPGSSVSLNAMRADAAQYAAEGNAAAAKALSQGANQIANGTLPDVVYNCTGSFSNSSNPGSGNTGTG